MHLLLVLALAQECPPRPAAPFADSLLRAGRAWHASRVLPPLRATRPLSAESAALRAAVAEGLGRFLDVEPLLARARGGDSSAAFLFAAARADERAERWRAAELKYRKVLALTNDTADARPAAPRLALVLERQGLRDSAIAAWRRASLAYPDIADWLAIRRAALESDTAIAFAAVSGPRTPGALRAAQLFVAQRRQDAGNLRGALAVYQRWGRPLDVARVEFALGRVRQARARADSALFRDPSSLINPTPMLAALFLTERFDTLSLAENLGVSEVYRARGDEYTAARYARAAIARGTALRPDTAIEGWLRLARLESESRNLVAALRALDSAGVRAGRRRAGVIAAARVQVYARANNRVVAESLLRQMTRLHAGDTSIARVVLLFADRDRGAGDVAAERERYHVLRRRFPEAPATAAARFRVGLLRYLSNERDSALDLVSGAAARDSTFALGLGPRYWEARLRYEGGDSAAVAKLRAIAAGAPISFYGTRARELLGDTAFLTDSVPPMPRLGSFPPARARDRIRLLRDLGFDGEARNEATGWTVDSSASVWVLIAAASAAGDAGFARESIVLGDAARARAGMTLGVARALFPYSFRGVIEAESAELCVDPLLMAAIIRQESRFEPGVVSRVGARGLSQIMPATGEEMTRRNGLGPWDVNYLFVPDFNLHLGARYVRDRTRQDTLPVYALLASYNAGPARLARWRNWPEYRDPDLFAERVSITETRDYVRTVYASYLWYRIAWAPPPAPAEASPPPQP